MNNDYTSIYIPDHEEISQNEDLKSQESALDRQRGEFEGNFSTILVYDFYKELNMFIQIVDELFDELQQKFKRFNVQLNSRNKDDENYTSSSTGFFNSLAENKSGTLKKNKKIDKSQIRSPSGFRIVQHVGLSDNNFEVSVM